jgi:hypothetical protein
MINQKEYIDSLLVALAGTVERLNDLQRQTDMAKTHNNFSSKVNDDLKTAELFRVRTDFYSMRLRAEAAEQEVEKLRKEAEHKDHQILELKSKLNDALSEDKELNITRFDPFYQDPVKPSPLQLKITELEQKRDPFDTNIF